MTYIIQCRGKHHTKPERLLDRFRSKKRYCINWTTLVSEKHPTFQKACERLTYITRPMPLPDVLEWRIVETRKKP